MKNIRPSFFSTSKHASTQTKKSRNSHLEITLEYSKKALRHSELTFSVMSCLSVDKQFSSFWKTAVLPSSRPITSRRTSTALPWWYSPRSFEKSVAIYQSPRRNHCVILQKTWNFTSNTVQNLKSQWKNACLQRQQYHILIKCRKYGHAS